MIVQHRRRNDFFIRMLLPLHLHRRIHIDYQLQLQPIIERRQIELPAAGFIIYDLHVDGILRLTGVHPVNAAPQPHPFLLIQRNIQGLQILDHGKGHLELLRHKSALPELSLQRQHRPLKNPGHPPDQMPVAGTAVQDRLPVRSRISLDRFRNHLLRRILRKVKPAVAMLFQLPGKKLQDAVENIPHIHIPEAVFIPFSKRQPILQEMPVSAGRIPLQPADTVLQHGSVQRPCHHPGQRRITVAVKCRPDQLIQRIPILLPVLITVVKGIRLPSGLLRYPAAGIIPQHIRQQPHTVPAAHNLLFQRVLFRRPDLQRRKELLHQIHQIGRPQTFSVISHLGIGQIQPPGGFRHIQIQIQPLNIHLLPGRRRKLQRRFPQKFPVDIRNDPAICGPLRNIAVIHSQEKEHLHLL